MWRRGGGGGGAMGGAKILQKIMASPLSVIKIEQYCSARGKGGGCVGDANLTKIMAPPPLSLRLLSIVGSGEVGGGVGGGIAVHQNLAKDNGAPSLCH